MLPLNAPGTGFRWNYCGRAVSNRLEQDKGFAQLQKVRQ
jgi:hypothetical protein